MYIVIQTTMNKVQSDITSYNIYIGYNFSQNTINPNSNHDNACNIRYLIYS